MQRGDRGLFIGRLTELGLEWGMPQSIGELTPRVPEAAQLRRNESHADYTVVYAPSLTLSEIASTIPAPERRTGKILALGTSISARSADALQREGINYVDLRGNAYIEFDDILIDIQRRPSARSSFHVGVDRQPADRTGNLFTTKRVQILFALLAWPHLVKSPLRSIAEVSRTSLGQTQKTLQLMEEQGFLTTQGGRVLRRREDLLQLWVSAYPSLIGASARQRGFAGSPEGWLPVAGQTLYISGEAAAPGIRNSETLTLYAETFDPQLAVVNRWRHDPDPNIFVRSQFWRDPSHQDRSATGDVLRAPDLLIYADLLASGDGRQAEAAHQLRESKAELRQM